MAVRPLWRQYLWLPPGWTILPSIMTTAQALTFTYVSGVRMSSFLIRVDGGKTAKRFSWTLEVLALLLNSSYNSLPQRHHTLGKKCKIVLPTMGGRQVKVGQNWSTVRTVLPSVFRFKGTSKLRPHDGADRIPFMAFTRNENPVGLGGLLLKQQLDYLFRCEINGFMYVHQHYHRVV